MLSVSRSLLVVLVLGTFLPNLVPFMWRGFFAFIRRLRAGCCFFKLFCLQFFGDVSSVVLADPAYYPYGLLPSFYS